MFQNLAHRRQRWVAVLWPCALLVLISLACPVLNAQTTAQPPNATAEKQEEEVAAPRTETVTAEQLDQLKKQIEGATDLDEEAKKKVLDTWQKAADALARAVKMEAQAPLDLAAIEKTAATAKDIQTKLAAAPDPALADLPSDPSLADLTSALAARQPRLQDAKQKLISLEAEPARRIERRAAIVGDQSTLAGRKEAIEKELAAPAPADESAFATAARRALLQARLREVIAEGPAHAAELAKYDASKAVDLPTLRIQEARKEVTRLQQEIDTLNKRITARRSNDARYIAEQLELFAQGEPVPTPYDVNGTGGQLYSEALTEPNALATATTTAELADENVDVTSNLAQATNDLTTANRTLEAFRARRIKTKEGIDRVGLTGAIGLELRRQLRSLADPGVIRQRCRDRQEKMRDVEFRRLDLEDQAEQVEQQMELLKLRDSRSAEDEKELRLATDRYTTLVTLEKSLGEYFNRLGELDATEQEYFREIEEFSTFIRERVLWIRSNRLPGHDDAGELIGTIKWFVSPVNWNRVRETIWKDAKEYVGLYGLITLLITLLFVIQGRFRHSLTRIAEVTARSTCREFMPTIRAAVLTAILALAWPALPAFFCWRLLSDAAASPLVLAVGEGLLAVTVGSLTLNLLRQLCRPSGLGLAHFEWSANAVRLLRSRIYSLMLLLLPLLFVETTLNAHENPQGRDSLERLVFVVSLIVLALFQYRVLHPKTGVFRDYLAANTSSFPFRLRWLLFWAAVMLPLTLAALAIIGYYYTAYELSWRLHVTTWVLISLLVLRAFLIRWFVVSHRRLRIEQARQRRQSLAEEAKAEASQSGLPKPAPQEAAVDLQEVSQQTQRFIDSGLAILGLVVIWFVWVNVLPALGILDRWGLWETSADVTVEYTDQEGRKGFRTEPKIEWVTVADVLIAIVLTVLTFTAASNIPGLLEITILQRLPLEPASRYACRMVGRYLIVVVGLVLATNAIGIGWSQVQWLAAALTVGLGFGLQEIFANFVSGLIILFERPVRIGDIVTIGEVSGSVSRIQIRATTITDWDRKEYIVPNKEFVTGRLLNWTLSDTTNRVLINVGVAYGSNTEKARQLLLETASSHPNVLTDPAPVATFEGFGDSTLNLFLRCYLPNLDNRLATITDLHESIDRAFKVAGIEIAFPQQDLHIRSVPPTLGNNSGPSSSDSYGESP
ncbi:mechanosensitive ion channel domain-containing protein [Fuerstiella marisgermanici]|uniref:Potassium efflux system KefA n=1 Tax=Fuerstiella marisgermanici TaxID=1891926 RepID=A0A1P8WCX9_9PLAN|nr:mechanosensitive ion channel domain-containing protein [Fuerstiella marisgermanici]APZ91901.1 Potassium efflux system KefA precursor [Fuerstiella marisgermanici]